MAKFPEKQLNTCSPQSTQLKKTRSQLQPPSTHHSSSQLPLELPATADKMQPPTQPTTTTAVPATSSPTFSPTPLLQPSLLQPLQKKKISKSSKVFRMLRNAFRSFPIITPSCRLPATNIHSDGHIHGGTRMTGTLFGYHKARVTLAIQENSKCFPILLLELSIPTAKLIQGMASGLVRIALECERRVERKTKLVDEPAWTMYCNGRKTGYGIKREPTEEDLNIMRLLHAVSMGAGFLPTKETESPNGELTYVRSPLERVVGSKDSETFYMLNTESSGGPQLSIFFVRI